MLLLTAILSFQGPVSAEAGIGEKVIGSTIKGVVKAYVAIINIEAKKKNIIDKLQKMDEKKYRKKYTRLYVLIKDLPPHLKATYKVTPHMSKGQMIKNVQSVDKKTVYKTINSIPDETLTGLFKQYLKEVGQKGRKDYSHSGGSE